MKKMKKSNEISVLAASYFAGEMNEQESDQFLNMMKKDKELNKEFQDLKETWKSLEKGTNLPDSEAAWNNLHKRLDDDGLLDDNKIKSINPANRILRIAAAFIVFFAISVPAYFLLKDNFQTANDSIRLVADMNVSIYDLPDGSRVFLKNGTEINIPENFQEKRNVKLIGEAFFDIMADPAHPFIIDTENARITVLGTSFNVKENRKMNETEILVESGKVKVDSKNGEELILNPGQFARAGRNTLNLEKNEDQNYLAWKTREFNFENEKLDRIFILLEEVYKVDISMKDKEIGEFRLTSSYSKQSIDSILQTIGTAFDLKITRKRNSYELSKN
jgi:ferric-dicitrate binding protein FerR (iron transport regulator)